MSISFPAVVIYFAINISNPLMMDMKVLKIIVIFLFALFALQFFVSLATFLRTFLPASRHSAENKHDFIQKLRALPLGFFSKKMSGELVNTFTSDFLAIEQSMVGLFTGLFGVVMSCIVTSIFMFYFNTT